MKRMAIVIMYHKLCHNIRTPFESVKMRDSLQRTSDYSGGRRARSMMVVMAVVAFMMVMNRLALTAARLMRELAVMMLEAFVMVIKGLTLTAPSLMMMVMVSWGLTFTAPRLMRKLIIYETTFNILDRENIITRH